MMKAGLFLTEKIRPSSYHIFRSGQTRIRYKGKIIQIKTLIPRVGVCNWCRAVMPFDCKQTQMHHEQYDDNHPEKHIIEICMSCHKSTMSGRGANKNKTRRMMRN